MDLPPDPITPGPQVMSTDYITPSQPETHMRTPPLVERKPFQYWKSPSEVMVPFLSVSPSPAIDMIQEDFVMSRRKISDLIEDDNDIIEPPDTKPQGKKKGKTQISGKQSNKRGNKQTSMTKKGESKWVRFLDVAVTCASGESDDELAVGEFMTRKKVEKK
jgi:hypothetical protein